MSVSSPGHVYACVLRLCCVGTVVFDSLAPAASHHHPLLLPLYSFCVVSGARGVQSLSYPTPIFFDPYLIRSLSNPIPI